MKIKSLLLTGFFALSASAQAANLFVDPVEGSDGKNCASIEDRCKTIAKAVGEASSGDVILLKQGQYSVAQAQIQFDKALSIKGGYTDTFDEITRSKDASKTVIKQDNTSGNRFAYVTAGHGEWVYLDGFTLDGFTSSSGEDSGTVLITGHNGLLGGNLSLNNMTFSNNKMAHGGAIAVEHLEHLEQETEIKVTNSKFDNNESTDRGGAFYIRTKQISFTMSESSITNNKAGTFGGAIYINSDTTAGIISSISNTTVSNNEADNDAGAIFLQEGELNIIYSTIVDNNSSSGAGGGFNIKSNGKLELMGSIVTANVDKNGANNFFVDTVQNASLYDGGYNLLGMDDEPSYSASNNSSDFPFHHKDSSDTFTSKPINTAASDVLELSAKYNGGLYGVYTNKLKNGKHSGNPAIDAIPHDGIPFYGVGTNATNPFVSLRQAAASVGLNETHYKPGNTFYFDLKGSYAEDNSFTAGDDSNLIFSAQVDADGWVRKSGLSNTYWDEDTTIDSETWVRQIGGVCSGLIPTDARGLPRSDKVKSTEPPSACDIGSFEYNDYYNLDCEEEDGMRPENNPKSVSASWCFNPLDKDLTPQDVFENFGLGSFNWYWSLVLLGLLAVRVRK